MEVLPPRVKDLRLEPPFGSLSVARFAGVGKGKSRCALWECLCVCGKTVTIRSGDLRSGNTTSCGCGKFFTPEEAETAFWAKVNKDGPEHPTLGKCWVWTGAKLSFGYGHCWWKGKYRVSHHIAYELLVGPIPDGLDADHLCRNPPCVNPKHIEPVTHYVNVVERGTSPFAERSRQTHCKRGHEFTPENTYVHKSRGVRVCRKCHSLAVAASQKAKRQRQCTPD